MSRRGLLYYGLLVIDYYYVLHTIVVAHVAICVLHVFVYGTKQLQLKWHAHATRNKNACQTRVHAKFEFCLCLCEFFDHCQ